VLLDNFSGEGEWILAGEDVPGIAHAKSDGPDHAIKGTDLGADVVGAVTGFDVLVVGAAVEHDVAFEFAVSGVGVIGDLIGAQDVGAIVDLRVAPQVIDGSFFSCSTARMVTGTSVSPAGAVGRVEAVAGARSGAAARGSVWLVTIAEARSR